MKIQIAVLSLLMSLSACGDEPGGVAQTKPAKVDSPVSSKLGAYLSVDKICDVLSVEQLQSMLNAPAEVEKRPASFRDSFSCSYKWPRADAEERKKNLVSSMMAARSGDGPKLSLRDRMFEHQLTIILKKSQRGADSFVPKKLSEEQINAQIEATKKRTDEQLTAEQKAAAGDLANSIIASALRKSNENEEISGVGDAAYWSNLSTGTLEILNGGLQISVSPAVADTKQEDIANAKLIAMALVGS